jgi:hypothetical protein
LFKFAGTILSATDLRFCNMLVVTSFGSSMLQSDWHVTNVAIVSWFGEFDRPSSWGGKRFI